MAPKFRCWFKDTGTQAAHMVEWHELREFKALGDLLQYSGENKSFHLMQSTGLKDKNSVEIFEGDVLLHTSSSVNYSDTYWHSYVQAYQMDNGAYRIKGKHIYDTDLMSARSRIEVVGNIYQHQKLLEKEYFSTSDGVVVQADEK